MRTIRIMKREVYFSIIVPVYNVEKYIHKCVESILKQNIKIYELILVNDGSLDGSGLICDEYARKYKNIKVIHRDNGGLSAARNSGLKIAIGKYVMFLDSDDFIAQNALEKFYEVTKNDSPDVIAAYGYKYFENGNLNEGVPFRNSIKGIVNGKEFYKKALYQNKMSVGAPYYLTSMELIKKYKLNFRKDLLHEDELWTPILLLHAQRVIDLPFRFYYYRSDNLNSITRSTKNIKKRAMSRLHISELLSNELRDYDGGGDVDCFYDNIAAQYMYAVYDGKLYRDMKLSRRFPLQHARTFKYKIKAFLFWISPRIACQLRKFK